MEADTDFTGADDIDSDELETALKNALTSSNKLGDYTVDPNSIDVSGEENH